MEYCLLLGLELGMETPYPMVTVKLHRSQTMEDSK
jgi:hypothetical protein